MTTLRTTTSKKTARDLPDAFYSITALLHTMRTIAQHEDRLCLLRNEIKRTHAVGPRLMKELKTLLEELPAEEYTVDFHAVETALSKAAPAKKPTKKPARKPAPKTARKSAKRPE